MRLLPAVVPLMVAGLALSSPCAGHAAQDGLLSSLVPQGTEAPASATAPEGETAPAEPALPPVSELVPRASALSDQADEAGAEIKDVVALQGANARAADLAERERSLARRLDEVLSHEYVSDDRVSALVEEADFLASRLSAAMADASDRVDRLDAIRKDWQGRRDLWRRWRAELADDPEYRRAYSADVTRALGRIEGVLEEVTRAIPEAAALQQELRETETRVRRLHERAQGFLRSWRDDLLTRTAPVLFSSEHRQGLGAETWRRVGTGLAGAWGGEWRIERFQVWILLLQAALALAVGWVARRLRPRVADDARWAAVLRHPWAIGVLTAAAGASLLYGPLPPLGRLALEATVAGAASLVASGMYRNPTKRRAVYTVSALYVLFSALDAISFPVPLLRVFMAALALAGAAGLLVAARRAAGSAWAHQRGFRWVLVLGAVALAVVCAAEVLGYHFLGQWLLEATVATAFVAFVVSFLLRLARGALHLALAADGSGRARFLARLGSAVTDRLFFLVKVALLGTAGFYVLSIWDLTESPGQAWQQVIDAGFSIGGRQITVGRILVGVLAVYLSFVVSWALRALLSQTFFERRQFERGIRDSIATLLHYAVIVVGVFVGLSLFGFDLTNFALIAGALGVGVGFGLQNVVNNFVSGLILLFERPIRVGDIVVLGEDWGTVEKIGLRSTVIVTFNGSEMIVPNGVLIADKVTNWTLTTPRARLVLPVGAAYGNDPARVIQVLEEVGRGYPLALADPPPMAVFTGFGDSSLDFELRVWLGAFDQLLRARSEIASAIVARFDAEGISIPFPQRDLHVKSMAPEAQPSGRTE